ncbi:hypothetical protein E4U32_000266 [Claviceps aff. humidiphila group G2b]|nr:hypothetical protein E4U32_000266 [Claviceps aff. humidiphila group G2b]
MFLHNEALEANSSEHRKDVDNLRFFPRSDDGLGRTSKAFFKKCKRGRTPRYKDDMWADWPDSPVEKKVLRWLERFCKKLEKFARHSRPYISHRRQLLGTRCETIADYSVANKRLDVGFVDASYPKRGSRDRKHPWPQMLVPEVLNCNPLADGVAEAQRKCFSHKLPDGGIASQQIDINKEPIKFIEVMLGFLWMSEKYLGFDPTIQRIDGERFVEIERNGKSEYIVIDGLIMRMRCMVGRATTCWNFWKTHVKDHPETPLVIKDSWQPLERDEEGEMLKQATSRNVVNVARYYHHETVRVGGIIDDVRNCVRRELDVSTASTYQQGLSQDSSGATAKVLHEAIDRSSRLCPTTKQKALHWIS